MGGRPCKSHAYAKAGEGTRTHAHGDEIKLGRCGPRCVEHLAHERRQRFGMAARIEVRRLRKHVA